MRSLIILSAFISAPLTAQGTTLSLPDPAVESARNAWEPLADYLTKSAEQMPESRYKFRPTPKVRTFGQLIGHIAGAQYMICAAALGEPPRAEGDIEKSVTGKTALIAALKASTEFCRRAYAQSGEDSRAMTKLFGEVRPRIYALIANATHDGEHYGNIVTYLRINRMVPPSSQPAPATR